MTADEANYWLSRIDFGGEVSLGCNYGEFSLNLGEQPALSSALRDVLEGMAS